MAKKQNTVSSFIITPIDAFQNLHFLSHTTKDETQVFPMLEATSRLYTDQYESLKFCTRLLYPQLTINSTFISINLFNFEIHFLPQKARFSFNSNSAEVRGLFIYFPFGILTLKLQGVHHKYLLFIFRILKSRPFNTLEVKFWT